MNALIRIPERVETRSRPSSPGVPIDPTLLGVVAAILLWVLLHLGLAASWLNAGAH